MKTYGYIVSLSFAVLLVLSVLLNAGAVAADGPWPQWRGPERDDISAETGLLQTWPEGGPKKIWSFKDCGLGYSGPAIVGDRLYILGSRDLEETLLCLDAVTGEELWAKVIGPELENGWGNGPRSTPTVEGEFVYAVTGPGILGCFHISDGHEIWTRTMDEFGGKVPFWGTASRR